MLLRPYQSDALEKVQSSYRSGLRRVLLCSPTGSGKSAMVGHMLGRTKKRCLILAHRENLVEMISNDLKMPHGIIAAGKRVPDAQIMVGMMQTVSRRLDVLPKFDWVLSDECHLAMSPTWQSILERYREAWQLGMSATPCRLDGKGLGTVYQGIVYGPTIRELTDRGYLVPSRVFAPPMSSIPQDLQKLSMDAAADLLSARHVTGSAIDHLKRLGPSRRTLVFACNRKHAEEIAGEFRAAGFAAAAVDASMSDKNERIKAFRSGATQVLVNVDLLTTGFDMPVIDCLILLRYTESLALYLQIIGRGLRLYPGKRDCLVLDHVGCVLKHGMPDEEREWTLDGRAKRSGPISIKQCPSCYAVFSPSPRCPMCGESLAVAPAKRRAMEQVAGELAEVQSADVKAAQAAALKSMLRSAHALKTYEQAHAAMKTIAQARGYKHGWVFMQMKLWARGSGRRKEAA